LTKKQTLVTISKHSSQLEQFVDVKKSTINPLR